MKAKYLLSIALLVVVGLALSGCAWLFAPRITAALSASPASGEAPLSVTFTLSGSTGNIVAYTLKFGDGSTPATGTDITTAVTHEYDEAGTFTAELTVQDAQGRTAKETKTITVTEPDVPDIPEFEAWLSASPKTVDAGENVTFTFGGSITPATGPKIESWELSYAPATTTLTTTNSVTIIDTGTVDGYTFSSSRDYVFATSGSYEVTLTVFDENAGVVEKTVSITVSSEPPEIVAFTYNAQTEPTVIVDQSYDFAFTANAGAGQKLVEWRLDYGVDGEFIQQGIAPDDTFTTTISYTYTQTGSYTATLTVWDDLDQTATEELTIEVNPAP